MILFYGKYLKKCFSKITHYFLKNNLKDTKSLDFSNNKYYEPNFKFYDQTLIDAIEQKNFHVDFFFTLLSINHTVTSELKNNVLTYQPQSPDEGALVSAARNFGYIYVNHTPTTKTCVIQGDEKTYEIYNILDFNNERKRMSVSFCLLCS